MQKLASLLDHSLARMGQEMSSCREAVQASVLACQVSGSRVEADVSQLNLRVQEEARNRRHLEDVSVKMQSISEESLKCSLRAEQELTNVREKLETSVSDVLAQRDMLTHLGTEVSYLSARIERELTSLWEGVTEVKQVVKVETVQQDNLGNVEAQLAKLMGKEVQMREALQDGLRSRRHFEAAMSQVERALDDKMDSTMHSTIRSSAVRSASLSFLPDVSSRERARSPVTDADLSRLTDQEESMRQALRHGVQTRRGWEKAMARIGDTLDDRHSVPKHETPVRCGVDSLSTRGDFGEGMTARAWTESPCS